MTEYDEELHMKLEREEHFERGVHQGKADSICFILETKGTIPKELVQRIKSECDLQVLDAWLMLAIKVSSIEEFQRAIQK